MASEGLAVMAKERARAGDWKSSRGMACVCADALASVVGGLLLTATVTVSPLHDPNQDQFKLILIVLHDLLHCCSTASTQWSVVRINARATAGRPRISATPQRLHRGHIPPII